MSTDDRKGEAPGDQTIWERYRARLKKWGFGRSLTHEERKELLEKVYFEHDPGRLTRFWLLLTLSVIIASLGMAIDSTAVVIGAMILSPLMTPLLGLTAGLLMVWPHRIQRSGLILVFASLWTIAVAWVIGTWYPLVVTALPTELLARTQPNVADLFIALAAGAAGAIAIVRDDVSFAAPGVAIAVAMVPPAAATGMLFGIGEMDLAGGAGLLYLTNLVAISFAAGVTLLGLGFLPRTRLRQLGSRVWWTLAVLGLVAAALAVPLSRALVRVSQQTETQAAAERVVGEWLGPTTTLRITDIGVRPGELTVSLEGPEQPPPATNLAREMRDVVSGSVRLRVEWTKTEDTVVGITAP